MTQTHDKSEILAILNEAEVTAVATSSGKSMRNRMMHFTVDDDLNVYLASMKGDPKMLQMTRQPSVALLVYRNDGDVNGSREVEITGRPVVVRDEQQREHALRMCAKKSPVVKYLVETGNAGMLDCIKVAPDTVKYRIFNEIVQGNPPTVLDFPENRIEESDLAALKAKVRNWQVAVRVPFLTASIVPVVLGTAVAGLMTGAFLWHLFLLTLVAGLFIQAGTNVINDYFDHRNGNDDLNREFVRPFSGGSRAIQLGLLSPLEMLGGALLFLAIASIIGVYLALDRGPLIFLLGVIGLVSGVFYTGKPFNFASRGVGELLVGVNFGVLMTLGAYYVQAQTVSWIPVVAAIPVSLLIAAVLYVNELPDFNADRAVGKDTVAVRLGRARAFPVYLLLMAGTYLSILAGALAGLLPMTSLLALITLPMCVRAAQYIRKHHSSSFDLVPANAMTVMAHLITGLLLAVAFTWAWLGAQQLVYVLVIAAGCATFSLWMYRHIERQKDIFLGLRQSMQAS
ncbi:MAG: 1,4-dihydroxy-2-naphthoate octaprenyltransferase [Chloroflexi bacterium]|nr:1,4-dihydroxy-2-naphthoate octaprenyltransferase [Chloroflexota bacterium]